MENKELNIYQKLSLIQNEMNVPKNLFNKFGNYFYRNAETIFDTAKKVCNKYGLTLIVSDDVVLVGSRYYVKATATVFDWNGTDKIENIAYAREEENKKGMDGSQVTGSCSSYARKYALNGLFNLDDVKDADSNEQSQELKEKNVKTSNVVKESPEEVEKRIERIKDKLINFKIDIVKFEDWLIGKYGTSDYKNLKPYLKDIEKIIDTKGAKNENNEQA